MRDIAKELGVSAMTVSKVLNGKPGVGAETRQRVLDTAKRLEYKPNMIAKSMRLNQSKIIGLVISDSSFSFFPSVIKGIEDCAMRNGYSILLCNTDGDYKEEKEKIELLLNQRVAGLILAASTFISNRDTEYLKSLGIPFVYAIRIPKDESVDHVANDNFKGSFLMIDYLIRTGSQKIHFFNMRSASTSALKRLAGYKKALEKHGIAFDEEIVHKVDHSVAAGYAQAKKMLSSGDEMQTVFCGCDVMAIGVIEAVLELGLKIPDDIRVASYDDIEFARYLQVPLTTVAQPKYEIGERSVELLLRRMEDSHREPQSIILEPELTIRKST